MASLPNREARPPEQTVIPLAIEAIGVVIRLAQQLASDQCRADRLHGHQLGRLSNLDGWRL